MMYGFNKKSTRLAVVFMSGIMQKYEVCSDSGSPDKKGILTQTCSLLLNTSAHFPQMSS